MSVAPAGLECTWQSEEGEGVSECVYVSLCVCVCGCVGVFTLFRGTESSCSSVIPRQTGFSSRVERNELNGASPFRERRV